jgi:hypothetical protein
VREIIPCSRLPHLVFARKHERTCRAHSSCLTPPMRPAKLGDIGILFPMLRAFEQGGFQGRTPHGGTYDCKAWDGTPHGYDGLLVDGCQALLAVPSR